MAHRCTWGPSTGEVATWGLEVWPGLCGIFQVTMGHTVKPCLKEAERCSFLNSFSFVFSMCPSPSCITWYQRAVIKNLHLQDLKNWYLLVNHWRQNSAPWEQGQCYCLTLHIPGKAYFSRRGNGSPWFLNTFAWKKKVDAVRGAGSGACLSLPLDFLKQPRFHFQKEVSLLPFSTHPPPPPSHLLLPCHSWWAFILILLVTMRDRNSVFFLVLRSVWSSLAFSIQKWT